jgi:hypothetical protein
MTFLIRAAVPGDMTASRDVFRRSSLPHESDRMNLLAHPDVLKLSGLVATEGRTRAAVRRHGLDPGQRAATHPADADSGVRASGGRRCASGCQRRDR